MRADAQRSRQALLSAAGELFVSAGLDAPLEAVARRAGVGIALYRHFPDRLALVTAVAVDVMPPHRRPATHRGSLPACR
jgi:AcrR family transcriptional regulator